MLGYGSQGHAHALNLADSGRRGRGRPAADEHLVARDAEDAGLPVRDVADAVKGAQVVAILVPDGPQAALFRDEVAPNLARARRVLFAHGFSVHYGRIDFARRPST